MDLMIAGFGSFHNDNTTEQHKKQINVSLCYDNIFIIGLK